MVTARRKEGKRRPRQPHSPTRVAPLSVFCWVSFPPCAVRAFHTRTESPDMLWNCRFPQQLPRAYPQGSVRPCVRAVAGSPVCPRHHGRAKASGPLTMLPAVVCLSHRKPGTCRGTLSAALAQELSAPYPRTPALPRCGEDVPCWGRYHLEMRPSALFTRDLTRGFPNEVRELLSSAPRPSVLTSLAIIHSLRTDSRRSVSVPGGSTPRPSAAGA